MMATKKRSAVACVRKSGLELIRAKPGQKKGKPASAEDDANFRWRRWKGPKEGLEKGELFPTGKQINQLTAMSRVAYVTMCKSRKELIEMHGDLEHEIMDEIFADLSQAAEDLKFIAHMIETASLRILAAGAALEAAGLPFKFKEDEAA